MGRLEQRVLRPHAVKGDDATANSDV
jgi:hypothetical protein